MPDCIGHRKRKRKMDKDRNLPEGSISEKISVEINGIQQGMFIKGRDINKPVLLLLHGGPGTSDYFLTREYPTDLEDEFVVCYWEQRGTGLSYHSSIAAETMMTKQFISDTISVTNYLRGRFGKEKIYLMGHSRGTYIGIQAAAAAPDLYFAYISMSQVAAQTESEKIAYDYMLQQYKSAGNECMIKKFEAYPIMESGEALKKYSGSLLRDEMFKFDANKDVPSIDIPVYFFAGLYDYTCCYPLQRKYFESIKAPVKAFYTFEESAHSPLFEEPDKALMILIEDVLQDSENE